VVESVLAAEHVDGCLDALFDGPLTEYEGSDESGDALSEPDGEGEDVSSELPVGAEDPESSRDAAKRRRAARQNARKKKRRNWARRCKQEEAGTSEKDHVKRHRMQSAGSSIPTDFNAFASPNVTAPTWIGKQLGSLPRHFRLQELCDTYPHLKVVSWDDR
jgi:hypothetical protein